MGARRDTGTAEGLILAGSILGGILILGVGVFLTILGAAFLGFSAGGSGGFEEFFLFPFEMMGAMLAMMFFVGLFFLAIGAAWIWGTLLARRKIRQGDVAGGSMLAMILGGVLVVLGISSIIPAIPGGLVLAGGILARSK